MTINSEAPNNSKRITNIERGKKERLNSDINVKGATYFDVAVMRCLLSPKWNSDGYIWALEYLSHRASEITDYTLREQDTLYQITSESTPCHLDFDATDDTVTNKNNQFEHINIKKNQAFNNQFMNFVKEINDNKLRLDNAKRKIYELNFHTRIRYVIFVICCTMCL